MSVPDSDEPGLARDSFAHVRGLTPPNHDEGWYVAAVARRVVAPTGNEGRRTLPAPTGHRVDAAALHLWVSLKRDRHPELPRSTAEFAHHAFPHLPALEAWLGVDGTDRPEGDGEDSPFEGLPEDVSEDEIESGDGSDPS